MQNSYSWSYVHLEGKILTIQTSLLTGPKKTEVATDNSKCSFTYDDFTEMQVWKYGIYKPNINDKAISAFEGTT